MADKDHRESQRIALKRLTSALFALSEMRNGKTLFESSPTVSQEAYEAWMELNAAQTLALHVIYLESPSGELPEALDSDSELRKAAQAVAACGWGTSVSESEHFARLGKMDRLRDVLAKIDRAEKVLLEGSK